MADSPPGKDGTGRGKGKQGTISVYIQHRLFYMVCDICGEEGARIRKITDVYGKGKHLLVIENIPMVSCSKCVEGYFTAGTLHEIERIKIHRTTLAIKRPKEVVSF